MNDEKNMCATPVEADSDSDQSTRSTVPEGQVLLYARGMRVAPPQPSRSAWALLITGVLPGLESGPPAAVTATWCHGPLCSAETTRRPIPHAAPLPSLSPSDPDPGE